MIKLHNEDNMTFDTSQISADLIFADCIYESLDFKWIDKYWSCLRKDGIFIVMTDYHSVAQMKLYLDEMTDSTFVNWAIYKQEWGGTPRKGFPHKHDDILIYCKGDDYYWNKSMIEIPKATAGTKFDKKGTGLKTPCSVFDDLGNFSTMSKERIKNPESGRNIQWQKPIKLMNRLLFPFTKEGDLIVDPFLGSGTTAEFCIKNNRSFIGIEYDKIPYDLSVKRIYGR